MKNQAGISLVELIVAIGIAGIVATGAANFLLQVNTSQGQFDTRLNANSFKAELAAILTHPDNCKMAIGNGFDPTSAIIPKGNVVNPALLGDANPQVLVVSDPVDHNPADPNPAVVHHPAMWRDSSAVVSRGSMPTLTLERLRIQLDQDLTPQDPKTGLYEISTEYLTTPSVAVKRKNFRGKVIAYLRDENAAHRTYIEPKVIPMAIEIERLATGSEWRILRCSAEQGNSISFGWSDATLASGNCVTLEQTGTGTYTVPVTTTSPYGFFSVYGGFGMGSSETPGPGDLPFTDCPSGTYLAKATYTPTVSGASYACSCTKSGCFGSCGPYNTVTGMRPTMTCCPSVK